MPGVVDCPACGYPLQEPTTPQNILTACPNCKVSLTPIEVISEGTTWGFFVGVAVCALAIYGLTRLEKGRREKMIKVVEPINDQPIAASFFGTGQWLTSLITPDALEVTELFGEITEGIDTQDERLAACWEWVANEVRYQKFIKARLEVGGKLSYQDDYWAPPTITIGSKVGNCAVKSFLLTSLVRNELAPTEVHCVVGNLYNGHAGGHAWVEVNRMGELYIMESTRNDIPPFIRVATAERYEAVHYFNDQDVYAVPGLTVLQPMTACYSTWLTEYLDWAYIKGGGHA